MESNIDKFKRIIDLKLEILNKSKELKKDSYQSKYRKLTGLLVNENIFNNDISDNLLNWLFWHIPGGNKMNDNNKESASLRLSITKASNNNPLYIDDRKFNKYDIIRAKTHTNEELTDDNKYLDVNNDGVITEEDIEMLRNALWQDSKYKNISFRPGLSKTTNKIEEFVYIELKTTSTEYTLIINDVKLDNSKILCLPDDVLSYKVISGNYIEEGEINVNEIDDNDNNIIVIEIKQDIASDTKKITDVLLNSGEKVLQEDITITRVAGGLFQNNDTIINLNGHKITSNSSSSATIFVRGTAKYTIDGEGTIEDLSTQGQGVIWTTTKDSKVIINNGEFIAHTPAGQCIYCQIGTIEINGGVFKGEVASTTNDHRYLLNCLDANYKNGTAKIIVSGGTFYGFDPGNNAAEGPNTSFLKEGYISQEIGEENGIKIYQVIKE